MHVEHFAINDGSNRQIVKKICKLLPNDWTPILALAFDIEAIYLGDLSCFVITAEKSEPFWISQLEQSQVGNRFHTCCSSVNIISKEQVVCVWHFSAYSEKFNQIMELAMNVSDDSDW